MRKDLKAPDNYPKKQEISNLKEVEECQIKNKKGTAKGKITDFDISSKDHFYAVATDQKFVCLVN
jgi:hypothetical protein